MSATVTLELPREIIHATRMSPTELRRELAATLFQQHKLSFGQARELAEMTIIDFQHFLTLRKIPIHYDIAEYEEDLSVLRQLGRI